MIKKLSNKVQWFITWNLNDKIIDIFNIDYIKQRLSTYKWFAILHDQEDCKHYHIYIYKPQGVRFSFLQNAFPTCHIDDVKGSRIDCYNYLMHLGCEDKFLYHETDILTNIPDIKNFILETPRNLDMDEDVLNLILNGYSLTQVLKKYPCLIWKCDKLSALQSIITHDFLYKANDFFGTEEE